MSVKVLVKVFMNLLIGDSLTIVLRMIHDTTQCKFCSSLVVKCSDHNSEAND